MISDRSRVRRPWLCAGLVLLCAVPASLVLGRWSDRIGRPILSLAGAELFVLFAPAGAGLPAGAAG